MRKIGIITLHSSINYGVYLQAFALQEYLKISGFLPTILDYNNMTEGSVNAKKSMGYRIVHISDTIRALKLRKFRISNKSKEREKLFTDFGKSHFSLSEPMHSFEDLEKIEEEFDSFVCGSDQIWNPNYTKGNPVYFLAFAKKSKRNMYAPSFGITDISLFEPYKDSYRRMLNELHEISVRESSGVHIVKMLSDRTPTVVVDPTLLLPTTVWEEIEVAPSNVPSHYILFYVLGNDKRYNELAKKISKQHNTTVITIPTAPIWNKSNNIVELYAGIEQFLYLMHHADYVFTDSFHGVAFSTIFRKNFTAIRREDTKHSLSSRIEDYLKMVGLENSCQNVADCMNNCHMNIIDYKPYEELFSTWQEQSKHYLINSLQ